MDDRALGKQAAGKLADFDYPGWTFHQTMAWICYRDPERINAINAEVLRHFVLYHLALDSEAGRGAVAPDCGAKLAEALRHGNLKAFRHGNEVPPEFWYGKALGQSEWGDYYCRRSDVLALWSKLEDITDAGNGTQDIDDANIASACSDTQYAKRMTEAAERLTVANVPDDSGSSSSTRARSALTDEEVRRLIKAREAVLGKRPPAKSWREWEEMRRGHVTKPRFEKLWREVYPAPPRGRPCRN